jgi:hypothetical protein
MFCFNSFKEKTKTNREESRVDAWLRVLMGKELIFVIFLIFEGVLFEVGNPHYICESDKTMSGGWCKSGSRFRIWYGRNSHKQRRQKNGSWSGWIGVGLVWTSRDGLVRQGKVSQVRRLGKVR